MGDSSSQIANEKATKKRRGVNRWFSIRSWMDVDEVKDDANTFKTVIGEFKQAYSTLSSDSREAQQNKYPSFEAMLKALNLDAPQLETLKRNLKRDSSIYLAAAAICVLGTSYLYLTGKWIIGFLSMTFPVFLLVKAAQAQRTQYQLQHHLVSCTFKEWLNAKDEVAAPKSNPANDAAPEANPKDATIPEPDSKDVVAPVNSAASEAHSASNVATAAGPENSANSAPTSAENSANSSASNHPDKTDGAATADTSAKASSANNSTKLS